VSLDPSHFVFRTLELPRAASPFIEGVVRAQIDRLTPWNAIDSIFGWSAPIDLGSDRVSITVAATGRSEVAPVREALTARRVQSIDMSTTGEEDRSMVISLFPDRTSGDGDARRLRLGLTAGWGACIFVFLVCLLAWIVIGSGYDGRLAELQKEITDRRAKLVGQQGSVAERALEELKKRKRTTPSPVMILEALSKTLPDDTHLTELRIENGKVQIAGLASDASELIHLLEQSRQFTHAVFFAPTVRGPSGGEIFHIEAHLEPSFEVMD
jgi:general secretion pathway protein L